MSAAAAAERPSGGARPRDAALSVLLAGLLAASVTLQMVRDRHWQPYVPPHGVLWIRSSALASRLALSFDAIAADVYWIRAVLYYGSMRLAPEPARNFDALYPLLELTTGLDPRFKVAYRFGAIFLAEPFPNGPGRVDQAIQLLERGLAFDPQAWEYMVDIGFIHYWWTQDHRQAAEWFLRAADLPGAGQWLRPLAAATLLQGGDRAASRELWRRMADTDVEWIRRNAERRLLQLDALDAIDRLNALLVRYQASAGRPPASWGALVATGWLRQVPRDPTGVPYVLDPTVGYVRLARESPLWPLPEEPARARTP